MKDLQSEEPQFPVIINKVGIKDIPYPIRVLNKHHSYVDTIADISMYVSLMPGQRGTHMSRFLEIIEQYRHNVTGPQLKQMCCRMIDYLVSEYAEIKIEFPYFITKSAPVSNQSSLFSLSAGFLWINNCEELTHKIKVRVGVTSLCPCSKEISKYGAHNQRAYVTLVVQPVEEEFIWFEDLINIIEKSASSPIYPLLKRPDEKFVTEYAYTHPMFMEDIVRKVYHDVTMKYKKKIKYIFIEAESEESIHQHLALSRIEKVLI